MYNFGMCAGAGLFSSFIISLASELGSHTSPEYTLCIALISKAMDWLRRKTPIAPCRKASRCLSWLRQAVEYQDFSRGGAAAEELRNLSDAMTFPQHAIEKNDIWTILLGF